MQPSLCGRRTNSRNEVSISPTGGAGGGPLENLVYDYNIRGWMLGANRDYLAATGQSGTTKFGFELNYDKATTKANRNIVSALQYNGNIAGITWKSDGDDVRRKYDFSYDAANRLLQGLFEQEDGINSWNSTTMNYKVMMGNGTDPTTAYDNNGNILGMTQYGWKLGGSATTPIDNMRYTYIPGTNRLKSVTDFNNDALTKLGDFRTATTHSQYLDKAALTSSSPQSSFDAITDYSYDVNGNMNADNNKAISSITYNHLNLPSVITVTGKGTITYTYDAAGNKLKKEVNETGQPLKTTLYIGGAVYENDVLQFIAHEEGRIRYTPPSGGAGGGFVYDYFIKDHLGNVRMTLTDETKTDAYPVASLETASLATESTFYGGLNDGRVNKNTVTGYPNDTYTIPNDFIQKLRGDGVKMGANMVLKVMAGDKYNLRINSWYKLNGSSPSAPNPITELANALANSIGPVSGGKATAAELISTGLSTGAANSFLGAQTYNNSRPKAYVSWVLLDEQFKIAKDASGNIIASGYSGFDQVGGDQEFKTHSFNNVAINKSGYLYIYVSNETPNIDVFFDNLQVTHVRGPLLEETHYYPFGLTMSGISSKSLNFGSPENKIKFQGQEFATKEFSDGSGLEMYEFKYRMDDPQIGRFWQIDPLANDYVYNSTYAFSENKVIRHIELEGLETADSQDPRVRALMKDNVQQKMKTATNTLKNSASVEVSAGAGVGVKVNVGPVKVEAGVNGPQAKVSVNAGGETKANGSAAGAGVKVKTPVGDVKAGGSVGNVKVENGKVTTNTVEGGVSAQPSVSKSTSNGNTSAKVDANSNGEVGAGGNFGFFGIFVKLNPVNLFVGAVQALDAAITYKVEEIKESSSNPLINKNVNRGPGN